MFKQRGKWIKIDFIETGRHNNVIWLKASVHCGLCVCMRLECKSVVHIPSVLILLLSRKIEVLIPLVYPFSSKHTYRSSLWNFKEASNLAYTQNPIIVCHSTYASFVSLQTAVTERSSLCGIVVNCFLSPSKKTSFHFKPTNLQPRYIVRSTYFKWLS
jgi:hypothetical protein